MAGHIFTVAELMYISGNCVSRPHSVHDLCHTALPGGAHAHLPRLHPPTDLLIESKGHSKNRQDLPPAAGELECCAVRACLSFAKKQRTAQHCS